MLDPLAFSCKVSHEKLAVMSIHEQIKQARKTRGWSMERLAREVSKAEGREDDPLNWQTVQQWENGASAPKRTRMAIVRRLLGLDARPVTASEDDDLGKLSPQECVLLRNYRRLLKKDRQKLDEAIAGLAAEREQERAELLGMPADAWQMSGPPAPYELPAPDDDRFLRDVLGEVEADEKGSKRGA